MNTKTNNSKSILTNFIIAFFGLGLVFGCSSHIISKAQNTSDRIMIETKSNIKVPNDSRLDNNETIVRDYIIKKTTNSSSSSVTVSSISQLPQPIINQVNFLGYSVNITNNNLSQTNNSTQNISQNTNSNAQYSIVPAINQSNVLNDIINSPSLTTDQTQELKQYALAAGDGWRDGKLYINNPIEAAKFIIKYPNLAKYVVSNLIRTGGQQVSLQSVLIPIILSILLISSIANLVNKKLKYNTK